MQSCLRLFKSTEVAGLGVADWITMKDGDTRKEAYVLGQLEAALPLAHETLAAAVSILILLPLILQRASNMSLSQR